MTALLYFMYKWAVGRGAVSVESLLLLRSFCRSIRFVGDFSEWPRFVSRFPASIKAVLVTRASFTVDGFASFLSDQ